MKKAILFYFLYFIAFLFICKPSYSQVAIGATQFTPNACSMLEVRASNRGILIPRIDYNNRPTSPVKGCLIYDTINGPSGDNIFYYYNGTSWVAIGGSVNYDSIPFVHNAARSVTYQRNTGDNVGIGTSTPASDAKLAVKDGHLQSQQTTAPSLIALPYLTYAFVGNATDIAGQINVTTTAAAGTVEVHFNTAYNVAPIVIITPANDIAAADMAQVYVTSLAASFSINFGVSVSAGVHIYNYQVIETY